MLRSLQALRGIGFLTAVTIVAESGDLRRARSPAAYMAYAGLVPSEHSSGASVRHGNLTKTGNRLLRHVLGESAHHARLQPAVSAWVASTTARSAGGLGLGDLNATVTESRSTAPLVSRDDPELTLVLATAPAHRGSATCWA